MLITFTSKNIFTSFLFLFAFFCKTHYSIAQNEEWEIDKIESKQQQSKPLANLGLSPLKGTWEVKLALGKWYFAEGVRSQEEESFFLDNDMTTFQLERNWHFSEKFLAELSLGFQLKRDIPNNAALSTIIFGGGIEIIDSGTTK